MRLNYNIGRVDMSTASTEITFPMLADMPCPRICYIYSKNVNISDNVKETHKDVWLNYIYLKIILIKPFFKLKKIFRIKQIFSKVDTRFGISYCI